MIRIGLSQRVELVAGRDERRDCLDQAWTELLMGAEMLPIPLPNRTPSAEVLLRELALDGVILTGGNDLAHLPGARQVAPERDAFESQLLGACGRAGLAVLGVCRGLQLMVWRSGGQLLRVGDHVATRHAVRAVSGLELPLGDREEVNSYHGFGLRPEGLGADLEAIATAPDGSVEAVAHRRLPQWGIMWHPEREPRDPRDLELLRGLFGGGLR